MRITPRWGLGGPGSVRSTLVAVAIFVAILIGVALTTGLSLKSAGVPYPGTIATAVTSVVFAVGGPMLARYGATILLRGSQSEA